MNVSITNACNRRCEYCFQRDWYLSKKANSTTDESVIEMTTEEFAHLCDWAGRLPCLKLLGGEPLLHSRVTDLVKIAKERGKQIAFISNISADEEKFDECYALVAAEDTNVRSFLINTDYPASQEAIFKRNLEKLCESKNELSFSTTLLPGSREVAKARKRIEELAEIYHDIRKTMNGFRVRLAPFCPNPTNPTDFRLYDFTSDVIEFINSLYPTGIPEYGFDCPVNLCELRSDFVDACRENGTMVRVNRCSPESGMPFDILVDHSVIWCSSANFLKLDDWRAFESFDAARHALSRQYYAWWRTHGEARKCRSCEQHHPGYCDGLCIAKTANVERTEQVIPIVPCNKE